MLGVFWSLLAIGFLVLAICSYHRYWILSNPERTAKYGEKCDFPRGVTWIETRHLKVVASLFKELFLAGAIGSLLAGIGAIIEFFI